MCSVRVRGCCSAQIYMWNESCETCMGVKLVTKPILLKRRVVWATNTWAVALAWRCRRRFDPRSRSLILKKCSGSRKERVANPIKFKRKIQKQVLTSMKREGVLYGVQPLYPYSTLLVLWNGWRMFTIFSLIHPTLPSLKKVIKES